MRVLAALSGGVDSTTAAALAVQAGHDVTGVTVLLWGGDRHGRSCSTADADAARAAADHLGIPLVVLDATRDFDAQVIAPFVADTLTGRTPNPCVECNRRFKLDLLDGYAATHGFDQIVTGHYARRTGPNQDRLARAVDTAKDQSYVLWTARPDQIARYDFPLGDLTKPEVRALAANLHVPAATVPDSMDLCFSPAQVVADRTPEVPVVPVVAPDGTITARLPITNVTVGQRRGLHAAGATEPLYATSVTTTQVTLGTRADLTVDVTALDELIVHHPDLGVTHAQTSAHGIPQPATLDDDTVTWKSTHQRVAPGQSVVLYADDVVVGGGHAR